MEVTIKKETGLAHSDKAAANFRYFSCVYL